VLSVLCAITVGTIEQATARAAVKEEILYMDHPAYVRPRTSLKKSGRLQAGIGLD